MDIYLTIITTVLVLTQIIRIIQNGVNLHRQNKLVKAQLGELEDVDSQDIKNRREVDKLLLEFLRKKKAEEDDLK